jgi:hypothetical protein
MTMVIIVVKMHLEGFTSLGAKTDICTDQTPSNPDEMMAIE